MSDDEEGTITPETRINQLEGRLAEETDRLEKLYVAYKKAEEDLEERKAIIEVLEKEAIDKEIDKEGLESLLSDKEAKIHDIEIVGAKTAKRVEHLEPELEKMEEMYTRESARLGRVFELAEELDESNRVANAELGARDDWYVQHMQLFEDLSEAMDTRYSMIDRAVEAAKDIMDKSETFKERMEEALDSIAEEVEDLVDGDDEGDTDESEANES
jgi:chromosome segregation ATPase